MNVLLAILWKDLVSEWRTRERLAAMLLFSLLVIVVFHFSLPGGATAVNQPQAPGLLWITTIFASILGLNRSFSTELENDALSALAMVPTDRGWVFLGKAIANWMILFVVQLVTMGVFALVFEFDLSEIAARLALVLALGSLGLCSVGTLFAAMAVRTRFREVMLPLLMIVPLIPVLLGAVRGTSALLGDGTLPFGAVQLLIVTDISYWILSFIVFEFVLDE